MRQADVRHALALVQLDPNKVLVLRRIFDIMATDVRENSRVAGGETERSRNGSAEEDCRANLAAVDVEPLFSLRTSKSEISILDDMLGEGEDGLINSEVPCLR